MTDIRIDRETVTALASGFDDWMCSECLEEGWDIDEAREEDHDCVGCAALRTVSATLLALVERCEKLEDAIEKAGVALLSVSGIPLYAYGDNEAACSMADAIEGAVAVLVGCAALRSTASTEEKVDG